MQDRTEQSLDLLRRMADLDPSPVLMGGYAEDALIEGTVSRLHEDVDWLVPRAELALRMDQARILGFETFETFGESAPGQPFYLYTAQGEVSIDIGVSDEVDDHPTIDVHRLMFEIDGKQAPAGFRVHLPSDTFTHPSASIDGIPVRVASPLASYQIRIGIASRGAFGELNEKQLTSLRRIKRAFFSDRTDEELAPKVEPLDAL